MPLCKDVQKQSNTVYITNFRRLSLKQYISMLVLFFCAAKHTQPCIDCTGMLSIANLVITEGYCKLSIAYKNTFPTLTYKADIARLKVLQMPLACIRVGSPEKGQCFWYLVEYVEGVVYQKFASFAEALMHSKPHLPLPFTRQK